jgi:uncharacterized protein (TIGR02118 family)
VTARFIVLYGTPADPAAFDRYHRDVHIPLTHHLPGLRSYTLARDASPVRGGDPYYLIGELEWDTMEDLRAAFASPEGQAAAGLPLTRYGGVGGRRLGQLDAVPSLPLGDVQGRVGQPFEPVGCARVVREDGNPDGCRDRYVGAGQGHLGDRCADTLSDVERRRDGSSGQQDGELLPAVAAGEVEVAQGSAQHRAGCSRAASRSAAAWPTPAGRRCCSG